MSSPEINYTELAGDLIARTATGLFSVIAENAKNATDAARLKFTDVFRKYLDTSMEKYGKIKTLLYRDTPVPLYSIYVPLDLKSAKITINNAGINDVLKFAKHVIVTGTGGGGKSTLMRHLFLDAIKHGMQIPVFVELRNLNESDRSLAEEVFETLKRFGFPLDRPAFDRALSAGCFVLFFDGFDEVLQDKRKSIRDEILNIAVQFDKNAIVVSSRPDEDFVSWSGFSELGVRPLNKHQAIELIDRINYDVDVKAKFLKDLQATLFDQHKSFASIPLLLTIMLMTYANNAEVPAKRHLFYSQAFDTLWNHHDAIKGAFRRERYTSLAMDDFVHILSHLCAQTYLAQEFTFTRNQLIDYISRARRAVGISFSDDAFLQDLTTSICFIIQDGLLYTFSHRSFQEYYTAVFLSRIPAASRSKMWSTLLSRGVHELVLSMLIEISPQLVEEEFLIPSLSELKKELEIVGDVKDQNVIKYCELHCKCLEMTKDKLTIHNKDNLFNMLSLVWTSYVRQYGSIVASLNESRHFERDMEDGATLVIEPSEFQGKSKEVISIAGVFQIRTRLSVAMAALDDMLQRQTSRTQALDDMFK